jgi:hypothetical protein
VKCTFTSHFGTGPWDRLPTGIGPEHPNRGHDDYPGTAGDGGCGIRLPGPQVASGSRGRRASILGGEGRNDRSPWTSANSAIGRNFDLRWHPGDVDWL